MLCPNSPREIRKKARWVKLSKAHRKNNPLCFDPFNIHQAELAKDAHHIISIRSEPALAYEPKNIVSLCRWCHNCVTNLENKNMPTSWLFTAKNGGSFSSLRPASMKTDQSVKKNTHPFLGGGGQFECRRIEEADNKVFCFRSIKYQSSHCGICPQNKL